MKKINYQFKIMSAIAIVSVVAGHCANNAGIPFFQLWFRPYSFHLPLFAFISGYFYRKANDDNYITYIVKKGKKLLLPLFICNILYGLLVTIISIKGFTYGIPLSLKSLFYLPIVNQHQNYFNCPAWYLIPLFMCYCIYPIIKKVLNDNKTFNLLFFVFTILLFMAIFNSNRNGFIYINKDFTVFITRFLLLFPFFHFGHIFHSYYEQWIISLSCYKLLIINMIIRFFLIYFAHEHVLDYSICWANDFANKNSIIMFLGSINAIIIIYVISGLLSRHMPPKYYINIANNTYDIMMHHLFGFFILNVIIALLSKVVNIQFDWIAFKSNIYYQISPFKEFNILYFLSGIIISLSIVKIKNYFRFVKAK